jgi:pyruvate dehydrogenase E2 component (dihydrolipoamide acetyltransferase)
MAEAIYLPKVGMTMEEGTLTKWLAADGDVVTKGQVIFEMETEKVQMEVEADFDGTLKQLVAEGAVLKPGDVVGCLLAGGEAVPAALLERVAAQSGGLPGAGASPAATAVSEVPSGAPRAVVGSASGAAAPRISPIARRLADEHGIDMRTLAGSGPDGRIVERDVQRAIEAKAAGTIPAPAAVSAPRVAETGAASLAYGGRRRTIGERMATSAHSTAPVTLHSETPVDAAMQMLHGLNREWRKDGVVVTLTALLVRACGLALREHPRLNSRLEGDQILMASQINVGVAIDIDAGLMVPVVRDADSRSLQDVARSLRDLTEKAKSDALQVDDMTGGSFTITSLEGSNVDAFTPIINPPQAAILGLGRVRDVAAFDGPTVVKRQVATLSLTFDHRVTDGGPAARFLDRVGELLGRPYLLM